MAEIERTEHGDEGRAREWMARALNAAPDPVWTADGIVSERWLPMSPATGRLDAFEWKTPLAELPAPADIGEPAAAIIEPEEPPRPPSDDATPAAAQTQEQAAEERTKCPARGRSAAPSTSRRAVCAATRAGGRYRRPGGAGARRSGARSRARPGAGARCPGFGLACSVPLGRRRVLANSGLARYQEREIRRNSSVGRAHHS